MCVAIALGDKPEQERSGNEQRHASLSRRETKSLPHFIKSETVALPNHEYLTEFLQV